MVRVGGCFMTEIVTFFIMVGCGATLYVSGIHDINDAADAAVALKPLAGQFAFVDPHADWPPITPVGRRVGWVTTESDAMKPGTKNPKATLFYESEDEHLVRSRNQRISPS
jgi:hypothetical protein